MNLCTIPVYVPPIAEMAEASFRDWLISNPGRIWPLFSDDEVSGRLPRINIDNVKKNNVIIKKVFIQRRSLQIFSNLILSNGAYFILLLIPSVL